MTAAMIPTETLSGESRAIQKFPEGGSPACARTRFLCPNGAPVYRRPFSRRARGRDRSWIAGGRPWLEAETPMALKLQRPLPDGAVGIVAKGEKEDGPSALAGLGARGKRLPPAAV